MTTVIDGALERLNRRLPLAARQHALPPELADLHRSILRALFETGRPPEPEAIAAQLHSFTAAPHQVILDGRVVHAMCAVDALSIAPMYGGEVQIRSRCRVTEAPVSIRQRDEAILAADPGGLLVGVCWQQDSRAHAAHSLCTEMIFLCDQDAALAWRHEDFDRHTVLSLEDALAFGARFFKPLVSSC